MPPADPTHATAALDQARQRFAEGALVEAVGLLSAMDRQGRPASEIAAIEHLQCLACYRLGQLSDSLQCARSFLQQADPGIENEVELRFSVLTVAVVAAGELARFEESLQWLSELLGLSSRLGSLSHYVRARGSAASAFLLLGDLWAAERVLGALACEFDRPHQEQRLETTMRCNHASLAFDLARMARDAGDVEAAQQSLDSAAASVERATRAAASLEDWRLITFVRLHQLELCLLQGRWDMAEEHLRAAKQDAEQAGLNAHWRHLQLLEAKWRLARGEARSALDLLDGLLHTELPTNELSTRIRLRDLRYRCLVALGEPIAALSARQSFDELSGLRAYRQAQAQSRLMRTRLEMEHLFLRRSDGKAFGSTTPAAAAATAAASQPQSVGRAPMSRGVRRPQRKTG
ncbi:hypothetical protein AACH06_28140 [Ideonella sp. DXS29W]|uniref:MalT-like TPR region domain-containing protein n=1 Tax=Ideonella lacteola TaxID=2984193 RepID=A0ABU9BXJ6_9BURK